MWFQECISVFGFLLLASIQDLICLFSLSWQMRGISLVKTTSEKAGCSFHGYMFILAQYLYYIQWTLRYHLNTSKNNILYWLWYQWYLNIYFSSINKMQFDLIIIPSSPLKCINSWICMFEQAYCFSWHLWSLLWALS